MLAGDDIARALQQMMDQPELRERSIGLGLERAQAFTWDKAARELLAGLEAQFPHNPLYREELDRLGS